MKHWTDDQLRKIVHNDNNSHLFYFSDRKAPHRCELFNLYVLGRSKYKINCEKSYIIIVNLFYFPDRKSNFFRKSP